MRQPTIPSIYNSNSQNTSSNELKTKAQIDAEIKSKIFRDKVEPIFAAQKQEPIEPKLGEIAAKLRQEIEDKKLDLKEGDKHYEKAQKAKDKLEKKSATEKKKIRKEFEETEKQIKEKTNRKIQDSSLLLNALACLGLDYPTFFELYYCFVVDNIIKDPPFEEMPKWFVSSSSQNLSLQATIELLVKFFQFDESKRMNYTRELGTLSTFYRAFYSKRDPVTDAFHNAVLEPPAREAYRLVFMNYLLQGVFHKAGLLIKSPTLNSSVFKSIARELIKIAEAYIFDLDKMKDLSEEQLKLIPSGVNTICNGLYRTTQLLKPVFRNENKDKKDQKYDFSVVELPNGTKTKVVVIGQYGDSLFFRLSKICEMLADLKNSKNFTCRRAEEFIDFFFKAKDVLEVKKNITSSLQNLLKNADFKRLFEKIPTQVNVEKREEVVKRLKKLTSLVEANPGYSYLMEKLQNSKYKFLFDEMFKKENLNILVSHIDEPFIQFALIMYHVNQSYTFTDEDIHILSQNYLRNLSQMLGSPAHKASVYMMHESDPNAPKPFDEAKVIKDWNEKKDHEQVDYKQADKIMEYLAHNGMFLSQAKKVESQDNNDNNNGKKPEKKKNIKDSLKNLCTNTDFLKLFEEIPKHVSVEKRKEIEQKLQKLIFLVNENVNPEDLARNDLLNKSLVKMLRSSEYKFLFDEILRERNQKFLKLHANEPFIQFALNKTRHIEDFVQFYKEFIINLFRVTEIEQLPALLPNADEEKIALHKYEFVRYVMMQYMEVLTKGRFDDFKNEVSEFLFILLSLSVEFKNKEFFKETVDRIKVYKDAEIKSLNQFQPTGSDRSAYVSQLVSRLKASKNEHDLLLAALAFAFASGNEEFIKIVLEQTKIFSQIELEFLSVACFLASISTKDVLNSIVTVRIKSSNLEAIIITKTNCLRSELKSKEILKFTDEDMANIRAAAIFRKSGASNIAANGIELLNNISLRLFKLLWSAVTLNDKALLSNVLGRIKKCGLVEIVNRKYDNNEYILDFAERIKNIDAIKIFSQSNFLNISQDAGELLKEIHNDFFDLLWAAVESNNEDSFPKAMDEVKNHNLDLNVVLYMQYKGEDIPSFAERIENIKVVKMLNESGFVPMIRKNEALMPSEDRDNNNSSSGYIHLMLNVGGSSEGSHGSHISDEQRSDEQRSDEQRSDEQRSNDSSKSSSNASSRKGSIVSIPTNIESDQKSIMSPSIISRTPSGDEQTFVASASRVVTRIEGDVDTPSNTSTSSLK